ncbi:MAG: XRE family transcriptional regulator [Lentisphaeria bacterium]|nr:XRE family transcriptional regulator [Lentisphaeria bacterium]
MTHHSFDKLRSKMTPDQLIQAEVQAKDMMAEMLLGEIRKEVGLTQKDLAEAMGIKQPSLSKLETQEDMQVSTLQRLVTALGGQLEIVAHMPHGDVRISQFSEPELTKVG